MELIFKKFKSPVPRSQSCIKEDIFTDDISTSHSDMYTHILFGKYVKGTLYIDKSNRDKFYSMYNSLRTCNVITINERANFYSNLVIDFDKTYDKKVDCSLHNIRVVCWNLASLIFNTTSLTSISIIISTKPSYYNEKLKVWKTGFHLQTLEFSPSKEDRIRYTLLMNEKFPEIDVQPAKNSLWMLYGSSKSKQSGIYEVKCVLTIYPDKTYTTSELIPYLQKYYSLQDSLECYSLRSLFKSFQDITNDDLPKLLSVNNKNDSEYRLPEWFKYNQSENISVDWKKICEVDPICLYKTIDQIKKEPSRLLHPISSDEIKKIAIETILQVERDQEERDKIVATRPTRIAEILKAQEELIIEDNEKDTRNKVQTYLDEHKLVGHLKISSFNNGFLNIIRIGLGECVIGDNTHTSLGCYAYRLRDNTIRIKCRSKKCDGEFIVIK